MIYKRIQKGRFLKRPNRFIAKIEINRKRRNGPCEEHREVRGTSGSGSRSVCPEV
mgnify:CR=1 FL=1